MMLIDFGFSCPTYKAKLAKIISVPHYTEKDNAYSHND